MKRIAVIFSSKYGATKKYATWISEELGADLFNKKRADPSQIKSYDLVVYGGGLYAGGISGLAPEKPYDQYEHNGYEDNADAHIKRSVMGREVVIAVTGGKFDFGPWEQIFYGEFDGMRDKRVLIKIIGE